jgi:hypothetical protein
LAQRIGERLGSRLVDHDGIALELTLVVEVAARGDALAIDPNETGFEAFRLGAGGKAGDQVPVARGAESQALPLAVDHQSRRRGLHATSGQPGADLAPQHRRHFVAVEAIEDAAGLLRVDEGAIDLAGVGDRELDRILGDLMEHHALHGNFGLEFLQQVPRDGLALAVLISREEEFVCALEGLLQLGNRFLLRIRHDVVRLEAVLDVDGELSERPLLEFGRQILGLDQVADVPDGGLNLVAFAQVLGDRLRLGRRLDDDELHGHGSP